MLWPPCTFFHLALYHSFHLFQSNDATAAHRNSYWEVIILQLSHTAEQKNKPQCHRNDRFVLFAFHRLWINKSSPFDWLGCVYRDSTKPFMRIIHFRYGWLWTTHTHWFAVFFLLFSFIFKRLLVLNMVMDFHSLNGSLFISTSLTESGIKLNGWISLMLMHEK